MFGPISNRQWGAGTFFFPLFFFWPHVCILNITLISLLGLWWWCKWRWWVPCVVVFILDPDPANQLCTTDNTTTESHLPFRRSSKYQQLILNDLRAAFDFDELHRLSEKIHFTPANSWIEWLIMFPVVCNLTISKINYPSPHLIFSSSIQFK